MSSAVLISSLLIIAILALGASTRVLTHSVERRFPPTGEFADIGGVQLHYIDVSAAPQADLLPMVFIHGAAGNAHDLYGAFGERLAGRCRMVFVDRPGAGYSTRSGRADTSPQVQARAIAGLIERLGIDPAVIVGHSFGGAVAAALAVHHPESVAGIVLIAPASHPWPGHALTWYYDLANLPGFGRAFAHLIAVPFGNLLYRRAVKSVFEPDRPPHDYARRSATRLVLRPTSFHANAADVGALKAHLKLLSPRYREIGAPVTIITGDSDNVVSPHLHAKGLERDIEGARLVWLEGRGHMPTYTATEEIVTEIEALNARIGDNRSDKRKSA
jgi:pimeloyl-ACP methyl ester carboxylesterase